MSVFGPGSLMDLASNPPQGTPEQQWQAYQNAANAPATGFGADFLNPDNTYRKAAQGQQYAGGQYQNLGSNLQGQYGQLGTTQQGQYGIYSARAKDQFTSAGAAAQGYMQPYNGYVAGGQQPGAYEQNWQGYANGLGQPTAQQGVFDNYSSGMGASYMGENYGNAQDWAHGPSAASNTYYDSMSSLSAPTQMQGYYGSLPGAGTSNAQGAYAGMGSQLQSPGAMEAWNAQNSGAYTQPGMSQGLADQGIFNAPGRSEGYNPTNVTDARAYAAGTAGRLGPQSAIAGAGGEVGDIYRQGLGAAQGANMTQGFAGRQLPGMEQAGSYEKFAGDVLSGAKGNPLQVLHDRQMAALNQQMAARGHFNSGGALAASGNLLASQGAEDFANMADLAKGQQEMGQARLAQAAGLAGSADQSALARESGLMAGGSSLQGLAGQRDAATLAREGAFANAAGMASGEGMGMNAAGQSAASAADAARMARLGGMGSLAGQADQTRLAGLQGAAGAAAAAQGAGLQRVGAYGQLASGADASELARSAQRGTAAGAIDAHTIDAANTMGSLAANADTSDLNRQNFGWNAGSQLDQFGQQQAQLQQLMAQGLDAETARRVLGQAGLAQNAQQFQQQRYGQNADNLYRGGMAGANIYGQYALPGAQAWNQGQQMGIDAYGQGQLEGINAYGSGAQNGINSGLNASNLRAMGDAAGPRQLYGIGGAIVGGAIGGPQGAAYGYNAGQSFGGGYGAPQSAPMQMPGAGLYPGYNQAQQSPYYNPDASLGGYYGGGR